MLIERLHSQAVQYVREIGDGGEQLPLCRDKIDTTLHNLFYLLKIVRAKFEVAHFKTRQKQT